MDGAFPMSESNENDKEKMRRFAPDESAEQKRLIDDAERAVDNTRMFLDRLREGEESARRYVDELRNGLAADLERLRRKLGERSGLSVDPVPPDDSVETDPAATYEYEIDPDDRVVRCGRGWDRFARENGADASMMREAVHGRSVWGFISDPTTESLYRRIVNVARGGLTVTFPLRCDAPGEHRSYRMSVGPAPRYLDHVRFCMEPIHVRPRPACPPAAANDDRLGVMLASCSWCNRVRTGTDEWLEIEAAAERLGVADPRDEHWFSHTTCDPCRWRVVDALVRAH